MGLLVYLCAIRWNWKIQQIVVYIRIVIVQKNIRRVSSLVKSTRNDRNGNQRWRIYAGGVYKPNLTTAFDRRGTCRMMDTGQTYRGVIDDITNKQTCGARRRESRLAGDECLAAVWKYACIILLFLLIMWSLKIKINLQRR